MSNIIEELWYGRLKPFEKCISASDDARELEDYIARHKRALSENMTDEQLAKLTPFQRNTREMLADTTHIKQAIISKNVNPIRSYAGIDNLITESLAGVTNISYNSIYSFFNGVGNTDYKNYYLAVKANIESDFALAKAMVDNYLKG